jgi:hypothetical protein
VECHEKWKRRWNRINDVGAISEGIVLNKMYLECILLYVTIPTVLQFFSILTSRQTALLATHTFFS